MPIQNFRLHSGLQQYPTPYVPLLLDPVMPIATFGQFAHWFCAYFLGFTSVVVDQQASGVALAV